MPEDDSNQRWMVNVQRENSFDDSRVSEGFTRTLMGKHLVPKSNNTNLCGTSKMYVIIQQTEFIDFQPFWCFKALNLKMENKWNKFLSWIH